MFIYRCGRFVVLSLNFYYCQSITMLSKHPNGSMRFLSLLLVCLVGAAQPTLARGANDDIRVLIDVSGSMVSTDPHNLRAPAMRMITGLLPTGSRAGVWTFGRYVTNIVQWGKVDDRWRKQAEQGADKIHSRSQFTNIESALVRASDNWRVGGAPDNRNIILLTDGKVDVSKQPEKNDQSRSDLLEKRIPELKKKGARVHTIALSSGSDEALLRRLAIETGGSFEIANNAQDLQRIFLRMFERAAQPDTVPLQGNEFSIDNSIKEMTLLVFRKTDKKIKLIQPDKRVHSQVSHPDFVSWRDDQGYALITVRNPVAGRWQLDADIDDDNRVMIVTDLKLKVNALPAYSSPDEALHFHVELHDNDQKISKNSFLKFVDFKLEHEYNGQTRALPLSLVDSRAVEDKGIYRYTLEPPLDEGQHDFVVSADARTFDRARRFSVQVQWPVEVSIEKQQAAGQYELRIAPREAFIEPASLRLSVRLRQPDGSESALPMLLQGNDWIGQVRADQQPGPHQLSIDLQAATRDGERISRQLDA